VCRADVPEAVDAGEARHSAQLPRLLTERPTTTTSQLCQTQTRLSLHYRVAAIVNNAGGEVITGEVIGSLLPTARTRELVGVLVGVEQSLPSLESQRQHQYLYAPISMRWRQHQDARLTASHHQLHHTTNCMKRLHHQMVYNPK